MSRAFVKEEDPDSPVVLADRPVSQHPNYVTRVGYKALQQQIESLETDLADMPDGDDLTHRTRRAELQRDLRYYRRRLDSAEIITTEDNDRVRFGHTVVFEDEDGKTHRFQIVGEDEADPAVGKLFYASPVANALIGREVGTVSRWQRGDSNVEVEILEIE